MPGQAVVTIKGKQWSVSVANTLPELTSGLSGVKSLPSQTGMLFDLGYDQQYIAINMSLMLFPLDIIFINSTQGVVGILQSVPPGQDAYLNNQTFPGARCFLEVNAGEATGIVAGDPVTIQGYTQATTQFNIGSLTNIMVAAMLAIWMVNMADKALGPKPVRLLGGGKLPPGYKPVQLPETKPTGKVYFIGSCKISEGRCLTHGYSVSETVRCPKSPLTDEEWRHAFALVKTAFPEGQHNPWVDGWWPQSLEEAEMTVKRYADSLWRAFRNYELIAREAIERYRRSAEKAIHYYREYVIREYEKGKELMRKKTVLTAPAVIPSKPGSRKETGLEYFADSPEFLTQTIEDTGYREKLEKTFKEAIARARGQR